MRTRRRRGDVEDSVRLSMPWDEIHVGDMTTKDRDIFERRMAAVQMYVSGETQADIWKNTHIKATELHRLLIRCLILAEDGLVWGARALIPYFRTNSYTRIAPISPSLPSQKSGCAGALGQVFRKYPQLEELLIRKILKKEKNPELQEYRVKPMTIHRLFINQLKELGHPPADWPFNARYRGSRSIAKFMKSALSHNFEKHVTIYHEAGAKAHLPVGTGTEAVLRYSEVYEAWEIDSHKIDAEFTVGIRNADGLLSYIVVNRINILALVDCPSTAVIWYLVVYNTEVSATDVVRLITESLRATLPAPEGNALGMTIKGDSGFPSEKIAALKHALPTVLLADNALSNLAASVSTGLRNKLGFFLNYGPPGHFEARPNVERTFRNIAGGIFQRFPNTTGASPMNGRAKNSADIARKYKIESSIIEELAYHHFAQHNALENEGIGYLSPLDYIRQKLAQQDSHFIPRRLLSHQVDEVSNYRVFQKIKVNAYNEKGVRPFIQIDRVRYSNQILRSSIWLKGTVLSVEIDEHDMRTVRAFLPNGSLLGVLTASGKWSQTKHSRKTRIAINQLKAQRLITIGEMDDPVEYYLRFLNRQILGSKEASNSTPKKAASRKDATELNRMNHEIADDRPDLLDSFLGGALCAEAISTAAVATSSDAQSNLSTDAKVKTVMPSKVPDLNNLMKEFK